MMRQLLIVSVLLSVSLWSYAQIDTDQYFSTNEQRIRYNQLLEELRCPKCQNQSLSASDAGIAGDLRNKVYELMQQGMDDEAIKKYLQQRYGDFVLYEPPLKTGTLILWTMPFLLIIFIAFISFKFINKQNRASS